MLLSLPLFIEEETEAQRKQHRQDSGPGCLVTLSCSSPLHPTAPLRSPRVLLPMLSHLQLLRNHGTEGKPSEPPSSSAETRMSGPLAGKDSLLLFLSTDFQRSGRYFSSLQCCQTKYRIPWRGVWPKSSFRCEWKIFFFFLVLYKSWSQWKIVPSP